MLQNIKTDIIYYKTSTDFEMEFNLCGCCRMRLLTDKAPDRKSLVHNLARAVSRSRIILIVGGLFGDEGTIATVAGAISKKLTAIDNSVYGISDRSEIRIIEGATPLVSADGCFGGCIIESGPQAMIILSDNKSLRKNIMNTLIHPYIGELAAAEMQSKAESSLHKASPVTQENTEPSAPEDTVPPAEDIFSSAALANSQTDVPPAEAEEIPADNFSPLENEAAADGNSDNMTEETEPEPKQTDENEDENENINTSEGDGLPLNAYAAARADGVELGGGMIFETDDYRAEAYDGDGEYSDLYIEPAKLPRREAERRNALYTYDTEESLDYHTDKFTDGALRNNRLTNRIMLVVMIILLITAAVLCYSVFYVPAKSGISPTEYIRDIFNTLFG